MLSRSQLERYRRMTPEERYRESMELTAYAWACLNADPPEVAARKWALIRRQHDEASRRLVEAFARLP